MGTRIKFNSFTTGFISGIILPVIVFVIIWLVTSGDMSLPAYIDRIIARNVLTHFISISVFSNIIIFLLFNRFDYLKSSKGVLGVTIIWALFTFIIKFSL